MGGPIASGVLAILEPAGDGDGGVRGWNGTQVVGMGGVEFEPTAAFDTALSFGNDGLFVRTTDGDLGVVRFSDPATVERLSVPR